MKTELDVDTLAEKLMELLVPIIEEKLHRLTIEDRARTAAAFAYIYAEALDKERKKRS